MARTAAFIWYKRNDTDLRPNATFVKDQWPTFNDKSKKWINDVAKWNWWHIPESPLHVFCASLSQPIPHIVDEITIFGPNVSVHFSFEMIRLSTQFNFDDSKDDRLPSIASFWENEGKKWKCQKIYETRSLPSDVLPYPHTRAWLLSNRRLIAWDSDGNRIDCTNCVKIIGIGSLINAMSLFNVCWL